ncbi:DNA-binding domain-containing protein [Streptomyces sp. 71268]|uniref:HvfC/BufC N-terminal domain-containing protein n=1 Tax=Streptomyces sp. 71268 TaxID=3002640 RepID=UPI0023F61B7A|nr:DNA-binding domain-containing protein [Streptomyces sp. 71268]WEV24777.1 DNA-binding domain-containing protein [Streptomyces sp. 71268]
MADLVHAPGALSGLQSWFQAALLAADPPEPDAARRVLAAGGVLDARACLDLYRTSYRMRLLESMRTTYPALRLLLGDDLFDRFCAEYLDACPPRSWALARLGDRFADHLEHHRPDAHLAPAARERWIDLVVDLAHLERTYGEVLDAEGTEESAERGQPPADLPDAAWLDGAPPAPAPCLRLLRTRAVVHPYLLAARRGAATPDRPRYRPSWLAVSRRDYTVVLRELSPEQYAALRALPHAATAREALGAVPAARGARWLRAWTTAGLLTPPPHHHTPAPPSPPHRPARTPTRERTPAP